MILAPGPMSVSVFLPMFTPNTRTGPFAMESLVPAPSVECATILGDDNSMFCIKHYTILAGSDVAVVFSFSMVLPIFNFLTVMRHN